MDFGYFTLSDNYYPHNPRTASDFVLEIRDQAILAGAALSALPLLVVFIVANQRIIEGVRVSGLKG